MISTMYAYVFYTMTNTNFMMCVCGSFCFVVDLYGRAVEPLVNNLFQFGLLSLNSDLFIFVPQDYVSLLFLYIHKYFSRLRGPKLEE